MISENPYLCWNPNTKRYEPCAQPRFSSGPAGRGRGPANACCFGEDCPLNCQDLDAMVELMRGAIAQISGTAPFSIPGISAAFAAIVPEITFPGGELWYNGSPTGYFVVNATNLTFQTSSTTNSFTYAVDFSSATECVDFSFVFTFHIVFIGNDFVLVPIKVGWCTNSFGYVVASQTCSACRGDARKKCSTDRPDTGVTDLELPSSLATGVTIITLPGPLLVGGDRCCEVVGLSTTALFLAATYLPNTNSIIFTNYSQTTITDPFNVFVFTTCGALATPISVTFGSACEGTISATPFNYYIGNFIDPGTITVPVRKTNLYTLIDPSGCCEPITISSADPNVTINDVGLNWEITINPSAFVNGAHAFNVNIISNCGIVQKTLVFNKQETACQFIGTLTPLETDFNTATGVPTIQVPAGGFVDLTLLTDLFSLSDSCCGTTVTLTNFDFTPTKLSQVSATNITDGLTGSVVRLTAIPGQLPTGVKNETLRIIGNCGSFDLTVQYELV